MHKNDLFTYSVCIIKNGKIQNFWTGENWYKRLWSLKHYYYYYYNYYYHCYYYYYYFSGLGQFFHAFPTEWIIKLVSLSQWISLLIILILKFRLTRKFSHSFRKTNATNCQEHVSLVHSNFLNIHLLSQEKTHKDYPDLFRCHLLQNQRLKAHLMLLRCCGLSCQTPFLTIVWK